MKKRSIYTLTIYILATFPLLAQPEEFLDGIVFDSSQNSRLMGYKNGLADNISLESSSGEISIFSWKKGTHGLNDGGVLLYGSPISVVLGSFFDGTDDSTFDVWKESEFGLSATNPLFRIDGLSGNTTFTGSNVSINGGTLSVGGSQVITAATASGVLTAQKFAKFSATNTLNVPATTVSTSSTTGALTVSGGLGVFGDAYINNVKIGRSGVASAVGNTTNIAVGGNALNVNQGSRNVAIGENAMRVHTLGSENLAVGNDALRSSTSGYVNTAIGFKSLDLNTTGYGNTGVGVRSLSSNISSVQNTGIGGYALASNSTGSRNVAVGYAAGELTGAGFALNQPSDGVYIGHQSRGYNSQETNAIVIGANAVGAGNNTTVIGNSATTHTHLKGKTVSSSIKVSGAAEFEGSVTLSAPQGDISMGIYE